MRALDERFHDRFDICRDLVEELRSLRARQFAERNERFGGESGRAVDFFRSRGLKFGFERFARSWIECTERARALRAVAKSNERFSSGCHRQTFCLVACVISVLADFGRRLIVQWISFRVASSSSPTISSFGARTRALPTPNSSCTNLMS